MSEQVNDERWLDILHEQAEKSTITEIARQLDYSRTSISLVMSGRYDGSTAKIAAKVIEIFTDRVSCPHFGCDLTKAVCGDHQSRQMPTSDAAALRLWMACRNGCPNCDLSMDDEARNA
jgi:hypothetical protein